ncbi:DUF192 domain-containing protein [Sphingomonas sp. G-3-2-10]|uniref:DUF192 domain-containing protein n=1 Tax=Sphingomonas sp. G-3-2-10 TaxID=2728838 RepID=UPI00146AF380|nr:DUF192 domain-containing protein [Sphingomonas sp. G-3-2-10]NML05575.1 DUF192 domain-containing protein [Sphingomonas sp. G-3-2-10]
MTSKRYFRAAFAAAALLASSACNPGAEANNAAAAAVPAKIVVTIITAGGAAHNFNSEVARTGPEQERGLMYRTNMPPDFGMLFAPYPAEGGPPREASFWMQNTPSPLDIIFIRPDGTIARIAENTVPLSEDRIMSGEPVSAVFEINGGRAAELGIAAGDKVSWPGQKK